jgi:flagellin-like hook-associated protein FlgL
MAIGGGINGGDPTVIGTGAAGSPTAGTNKITSGNRIVSDPDTVFASAPTKDGTTPVYQVKVTGDLPLAALSSMSFPVDGGNYTGIVSSGSEFYMFVPDTNNSKEVTVKVGSDSYKATFESDITTGATELKFAKVVAPAPAPSPTPGPGPSPTPTGKGLILQIGPTADTYESVVVTIDDMSSAALGVNNVDVSSVDKANKSIDAVDGAIEKVSLQRASLGALQNRLEHTLNNLATSNENLTSAESQIRDADMAKEVLENAKLQILQQASQAMLVHSNQSPQSVLSLLGA